VDIDEEVAIRSDRDAAATLTHDGVYFRVLICGGGGSNKCSGGGKAFVLDVVLVCRGGDG
jgi:hypothetical protein